ADLEAAVFDDQTIVDGAALGALGPEVAVAGTRGGAGDLRAGRELTVRALAGVAARRVGHVGRAVRIHDAVDHAGRALGGSRSARAAAGCSARRSAACCSAAGCSAACCSAAVGASAAAGAAFRGHASARGVAARRVAWPPLVSVRAASRAGGGGGDRRDHPEASPPAHCLAAHVLHGRPRGDVRQTPVDVACSAAILRAAAGRLLTLVTTAGRRGAHRRRRNMLVTITRTRSRGYGIRVAPPGLPALEMSPAPSYDELLPHDVVHFVVEEELRLAGGIFGQLAAGGDAGTFRLVPGAESPRDRARAQRRLRERGERLHREGR